MSKKRLNVKSAYICIELYSCRYENNQNGTVGITIDLFLCL